MTRLTLSIACLRRQRGFTMVELLVGMLIAMLATLIVLQVYGSFEGQKRTTTGGADAQTNGTVALFNIQRDVAGAGFGLPVFSTRNPALLCDPLPAFDHDANGATAPIGIFPALLSDGGIGAGASDSITVSYGNSPTGGIPVTAAIAANTAVVANNLACQAGDWALVINGSACEVQRVSAAPAGLPDGTHIVFDNPPALTSGMVTCLSGWEEINYAVANNALQRNGADNVAGIVSIQAQYGISATRNDNQIVQWVDPVGDFELLKIGGLVTKPVLDSRLRIKAIRVAVVARNGLYEKDVVSTACSSTTGPNPTGVCAWEGNAVSPAPTIDLSSLPDWDHYRYRVFDVTIPVRNVIWARNTL